MQLRGPGRSPLGRFEVNRTHGLGSLIVGNRAVGRSCTARLGSRLIRVFGGKSAPKSHLPRMVWLRSLEGGSGVGVW